MQIFRVGSAHLRDCARVSSLTAPRPKAAALVRLLAAAIGLAVALAPPSARAATFTYSGAQPAMYSDQAPPGTYDTIEWNITSGYFGSSGTHSQTYTNTNLIFTSVIQNNGWGDAVTRFSATTTVTGTGTFSTSTAGLAQDFVFAGNMQGYSGNVTMASTGTASTTLGDTGSNIVQYGGETAGGNTALGTVTTDSTGKWINNVAGSGTLTVNNLVFNYGADASYDYVRVTNTISQGQGLWFLGNANVLMSGSISGGGLLSKSGTGTLSLSNGSNSFTGGVTLTGGLLSFVSGGLGASGTITVGDATLQWAGSNTTDLSSRIALLNSATTTLDIGSNNVTFANGIGGGSTVALVKAGGGALTLSSSNGFSGGLTVTAGAVLMGNDAALGSGAVSLGNGVTLSSADASARAITNAVAVNGDVTLGDALNSGALSFNGGIDLGNATRQLTTPSNVTIASVVSNGGLTKTGAGTLTLGAANTYAGATTINGGTLALSGAGDISSGSTALVTIASGAVLDISGASGARTIGALSGGDGSSQVLLGVNTLRSVVASGDTTFGGVISGSGGFTKAGAGTLDLGSVQGFTGIARVEAGKLLLASGAALATASRIEVASEATIETYFEQTLSIVENQTLGGYGTISGPLELLAGGTLSPGGSVGTLNNVGSTTWNGGMHYLFEVNDAGGTAGIDPGWDLFSTSGDLLLSITGTNQIFIDLTSLSGTGSGQAANFDPNFGYAWKFATAGSTIDYQYALNPTWFQVTTGAFQNPTNGSFYVARGDSVTGGTSSELWVVYAAVPEPGTLALAGIGLAAVGWAASRRRRRTR